MKMITVKNCSGCPHTDHSHDAGLTYWCIFNSKIIPEKGIMKGCKLSDMPKDIEKFINKTEDLQKILIEGEKNMSIHRKTVIDAIMGELRT